MLGFESSRWPTSLSRNELRTSRGNLPLARKCRVRESRLVAINEGERNSTAAGRFLRFRLIAVKPSIRPQPNPDDGRASGRLPARDENFLGRFRACYGSCCRTAESQDGPVPSSAKDGRCVIVSAPASASRVGCNFQAIPTKLHAAPASCPLSASVMEMQHAVSTLPDALCDPRSRICRRSVRQRSNSRPVHAVRTELCRVRFSILP